MEPLLPTVAEKSRNVEDNMARRMSTRSVASSSVRRNREAVGRLRVRCISAQLPKAPGSEMRLFRKQTAPTAFADVYVHDVMTNQQSVRRRTRCAASANPLWKSEFWFAVRHAAGNLALHIDVFDGNQANSVNDEEPLGTATLTLDNAFLLSAKHQRQAVELELQQPDSVARGTGNVRVEVGWEPALTLSSVADFRGLLWVMARSVYLIRVMGIATLGLASCLLFVAQQARWLCRGTSLPHCETVEEPALATCAAISAIMAGTAGFCHFSGLIGVFGRAWDERPHSLVELAEADIEDEDDYNESTTGVEEALPSVQMQMETVGVLHWKIGIATNLFPRLQFGAMRLVCTLAHLSSLCLSSVALVIAWFNHEDKVFFAEAVYFDIWGTLCLVIAGLMFCQECMLMRSHADRTLSHQVSYGGTHGRFNGSLAGVDSANPAQAFQEMTHMASTKIKTQIQTLTREAEQLAQPLMEAQQRLHDLNTDLARPLLEEARQQFQDLNVIAQQRLHDHLDELNLMAQPLSQARQRIQTFGSAPDWIQPLVDAFHPAPTQPLPRQISGGGESPSHGSHHNFSPSHQQHFPRGNSVTSDERPMLPIFNSSPIRRSSASEFNPDDFGLGPPLPARRDTPSSNPDLPPLRNDGEPVVLEDALATTRFCCS